MKRIIAVLTNGILLLAVALSSSGPMQSVSAAPQAGPAFYLPFISSRNPLAAAAVTAGDEFSCAVTPAGGVMCWGLNDSGQIGDGTTTTRFFAVPVSGLPGTVSTVSAGSAHACALMTAGGVMCWGSNANGQLGNGTTHNSSVPVAVASLPGIVRAISAGGSMTCALMDSGGVECWGLIGSISSAIPVAVAGLAGVKAISAGLGHACALLNSGGVMCWGTNDKGQVGNGTATDQPAPVGVSGLASGVSAISAGWNHTCAVLDPSGGAMCWGDNSYGQLGNGTTTPSQIPTPVTGLPGSITSISAGKWFTCALTSAASASCWGINDSGQLGDGSAISKSAPAAVAGLSSGVQAISAGLEHACALLATGAVRCWGDNDSGQVGDATYPYRVHPVIVMSLEEGTLEVRTGISHTCAITPAGGVDCWGDNSYGQIGDNTTIQRISPANVFGLTSGFIQVSPGGSHTCALVTAGRVWCWGAGDLGQLGAGTNDSTILPSSPVSGLTGSPDAALTATAISTGLTHSCALMLNGAVKCWGDNRDGQLGDDAAETSSNVPVDVTGLSSGVKAISSGWNHTCALLNDGTVMCWGLNSDAQLGTGNNNNSPVPLPVSGLSGVSAISAGSAYTCALLTGGGVDCWGRNANGQLGNGTTTTRFTPFPVSGISTAAAISAGYAHTCAVLAGGGMQCWGANESGQLGNGTTAQSTTPVAVTLLTDGAKTVSAGRSHTCGLTNSNLVICWGSNFYGQLGIGVSINRYSPVDVIRQ